MLLSIHSYWAFLSVGILLFSFINALLGYIKKKEFQSKDLRVSLFTLILYHIQLLFGLGYYFISPAYKHLKKIGMGEGMKDAQVRLSTVEHPTMMFLAILFVTLGWSIQKRKNTSNDKFKAIAIYYGIALLFVLSRIPWQQWFD